MSYMKKGYFEDNSDLRKILEELKGYVDEHMKEIHTRSHNQAEKVKREIAELRDSLQRSGVKWDFELDEQMGFITELKEKQIHWATIENVGACRMGVEDLEEVLRELKKGIMSQLNDRKAHQGLRLHETVFLETLEKLDGEKPVKEERMRERSPDDPLKTDSKPSIPKWIFNQEYESDFSDSIGSKEYWKKKIEERLAKTEALDPDLEYSHIIPEEDIDIIMHRLEEYIDSECFDQVEKIISDHAIFKNFMSVEKADLIEIFDYFESINHIYFMEMKEKYLSEEKDEG